MRGPEPIRYRNAIVAAILGWPHSTFSARRRYVFGYTVFYEYFGADVGVGGGHISDRPTRKSLSSDQRAASPTRRNLIRKYNMFVFSFPAYFSDALYPYHVIHFNVSVVALLIFIIIFTFVWPNPARRRGPSICSRVHRQI